MSEFKIGDTVVLNSGGPDMTVIAISESGKLVCEWRKTMNETEQAAFRPEMLTLRTAEAASSLPVPPPTQQTLDDASLSGNKARQAFAKEIDLP